jgi:hypothetical protein
MTFKEWLGTVPRELTGDPLWRREVYRLSVFAADLAWPDATRLIPLLTIIPSERGYKLQDEPLDYKTDCETIPADLLTNVPMPSNV